MGEGTARAWGEAVVRVGTGAWSYDDWRGTFYPERLPATERLRFYSRRFPTVEIDSTFYHAAAPHVAAHWAETVPPGFLFSAKMPREITHERKLRDCRELLDHFLVGLEPLRGKLASVLIQLPPYFELKHDESALRDFIRHLPRHVRFAVEFRDQSWHLPRIAHLLEEHAVCWAWNDVSPLDHSAEAPFGSWPHTTDFLYLRLLGDLDNKYNADGERIHQYRQIMWSRDAAMENWTEKLRAILPQVGRVLVYAANHYEGFSPATATRMAAKLGIALKLPSREELTGEDTSQLELF